MFEKFLNSLINDLSFCLEEAVMKLQGIKAYETKKATNPGSLTKEDHDGYKQSKSICRANFQLASESLWNVKQLSTWNKQIFENETFAERIANTLNFVLKNLVGPES